MIYTTEDIVTKAARGFLEPVSRRSTYTTSRLILFDDGSTKPVLVFLAEAKFGKWDTSTCFPFWIDGNRQNETLANVDLATRPAHAGGRRRLRSALGVPSGTKEYMRKWREKNRERVKASQERYAERRRRVLDAVQEDVEGLPEVFAKLQDAVKEGTE